MLTSAGAIILLIFSTALATPTGDKQTVTERERPPCRAVHTDEHRLLDPISRGKTSQIQICDHPLLLVSHSSCCGPHTCYSTPFTWLHSAGAKNSFTYLTALLTPNRRKKDGGMRKTRSQRISRSVGTRLHLCPCNGFCRCRGAPGPRRCRWRHRWGQQL